MFDSKIRLTVFAAVILLGIAMLFMQWRISSEVRQVDALAVQEQVLADVGEDELPVELVQASADDVSAHVVASKRVWAALMPARVISVASARFAVTPCAASPAA